MEAHQKLQLLHSEKKLTKLKVQEIIGRSKPYTLLLFAGKKSLNLEEAKKIEQYFNLPAGYFSNIDADNSKEKEKISYLEELVEIQKEMIKGYKKLITNLEKEVARLKKAHSL